mgnify:CR=1 FL=1
MQKIPQTKEELAARIDHTNLKPTAAKEDILKTVAEALKYGFRGVCVPLYWVPTVKEALRNSGILLVAPVGFPLGYTSSEAKAFEAEWAKKHGADEIDMVMNISAFKSRDYQTVKEDIEAVIKAASPIPVKVIIETSYLTPDEISLASKIAVEAGAKFVKTNTGFGPRGAALDDVKIIYKAIGNKAKIKAAGGIRDALTALKFIAAGADVIGASAGVRIVETFDKKILEKLNL